MSLAKCAICNRPTDLELDDDQIIVCDICIIKMGKLENITDFDSMYEAA